MIRTPLMLLSALVAIVVSAGCTRHIDEGDAEKKIKDWASSYIAPVKSVSCPKVAMKAGTSFECSVEFVEGGSHKVTVELTDSKGSVAWRWTSSIVGADKLAEFTTEKLNEAEPDAHAKVDCGSGIKPLPEDGLVCKLETNGETREIVLRVEGSGDDAEIAWNVR